MASAERTVAESRLESRGKVRVGIVDYLNSRPLAWDFLTGRVPDRFVATYQSPASVADGLRDGKLDAGLVPSIEVQRIPNLRVLPGPCIAAQEEVRSVLLVTRVPVEKVGLVAVDENSRTSAALVRIILSDRYGCEPRFRRTRPRVIEMLTEADAALVIGDPALEVSTTGEYRVLDLAAEWRSLTGLPFVFAVWAVRGNLPARDAGALRTVLVRSRDHGRESIERIAQEAARRMGLASSSLEEYLTRNLSFELGREERRSLVEFYRRAARHGLLSRVRRIDLLDGSALVPEDQNGLGPTVGTGESG
jgi:chorismate dehydratase